MCSATVCQQFCPRRQMARVHWPLSLNMPLLGEERRSQSVGVQPSAGKRHEHDDETDCQDSQGCTRVHGTDHVTPSGSRSGRPPTRSHGAYSAPVHQAQGHTHDARAHPPTHSAKRHLARSVRRGPWTCEEGAGRRSCAALAPAAAPQWLLHCILLMSTPSCTISQSGDISRRRSTCLTHISTA